MYKVATLMFLVYAGCDDEFTLTTATVRDSTSAKPTTFFRRINVERIVPGFTTPVDLLHLGATEGRRSQSSVWTWDYYCQLQPKKGTCSKDFVRYYYDIQLDQCMTFKYSGCDGNKNNFDTQVNCERHCKGAAYMPTNDLSSITKDVTKADFCSVQPHSGMCLAMFTRYYYDINEGTCKTFIFGGCGGNSNTFDSLAKCLRTCGGGDSNLE